MFDDRLFHRLTREDDPQGWLVAADMLEEDGDRPRTALWRARAAWWPPLAGALAQALRSDPRGREAWPAVVRPWYVTFAARPKTVRVTLFTMDGLRPVAIPGHDRDANYQIWLKDARDPKYHRRRLFALIDALAALG